MSFVLSPSVFLEMDLFICLGDRLVENGALHMTLANICVDHYPYHEFGNLQ